MAGTRSSLIRWVVTREKFATSSHDTITSLRVSPGAALCRIPPDAFEALMSWTAIIAACWRGMFVAAWAPVVDNSEPIRNALSSW
jgi:hypothetical protein